MGSGGTNERQIHLAAWKGAEREERQLAQELHDGLCQSLVGMALMVQLMTRSKGASNSSRRSELLQQVSRGLDTAIEQSRSLMQAQVLFDVPGTLPELLEKLVSGMRATVPCEFAKRGEFTALTPEEARAFYRVARECLRNILREAQAQRIRVELSATGVDEVALEIQHDGRESRPGVASPIFEGDGWTRRFAEAAGLRWRMSQGKDGSTLRCWLARKQV